MIAIQYNQTTFEIEAIFRDFSGSKVIQSNGFVGDNVIYIDQLPNLIDLPDLRNFIVSGGTLVKK